MYHPNKKHGFTLLELMVATIIGLMLALTAAGTFHSISANREKIASRLDVAAEMRYVADLLHRDLLHVDRQTDKQQLIFVGQEEAIGDYPTMTLRFQTVNHIKVRPHEPESDVYEVEYYLGQQGDKAVMMRRVDPYPREKEYQGGMLYTLSQNIGLFQFRFSDPETGEWVYEWPEENHSLPQMVEVILVSNPIEGKYFMKKSFIVDFSRWPKATQSNTSSGTNNRNNNARNNRGTNRNGNNRGNNVNGNRVGTVSSGNNNSSNNRGRNNLGRNNRSRNNRGSSNRRNNNPGRNVPPSGNNNRRLR